MAKQSTIKSRRKYDDELKANVVRLIEAGRTVQDVSKSFDIKENIIYRWCRNSKHQPSEESAASAEDRKVYEELKELKAKLARSEQEREILKKALGIFSRTS